MFFATMPARQTGKSRLAEAVRAAARDSGSTVPSRPTPARSPAPPANDAPLTAAAYLRLRRQAAQMSRHEVARRFHDLRIGDEEGRVTRIAADRRQAAGLIERLETDGTRALQKETIFALGRIYPLDADVYLALATLPADQHPWVCRSCGCSEEDPCRTARGGICRHGASSSCSSCVQRGITGGRR